jgi:hypothetical protein
MQHNTPMTLKKTLMMMSNVLEAVALLRDPNLVWSADMQDIKDNLADILIASAAQGDVMLEVANNLAKKIIADTPEALGKLERR